MKLAASVAAAGRGDGDGNVRPPSSSSPPSVAAIPPPISRTALDSLNAKLSAAEGGWLDEGGSGETGGPVGNYLSLLRRIRTGMPNGGVGGGRGRRQTALVSGGYAARVAATTHVAEGWLRRASCAPSASSAVDGKEGGGGVVNVVVLGCGLDALGLWAARRLRALRGGGLGSTATTTTEARVYEFDAHDNCELKRRALIDAGLLREAPSSASGEDISEGEGAGRSSFRVVSRGEIALEGAEGAKQSDEGEDNYVLVSLDLRQPSVLSEAMSAVDIDVVRPTLVLSELVLAYLGEDGADATMRTVAEEVLPGNGVSAFVCLEPMFPVDDDANGDASSSSNGPRIVSVEEGYARDYGRKFLGRLRRGESQQRASSGIERNPDDTDDASASWLHPLGADLDDVQSRLVQCGFPCSGARCTSLGHAAARAARARRESGAIRFLRVREPFDEHAALALHLQCYALVVCTSAADARGGSGDSMCDWPDEAFPRPSRKEGDAPMSVDVIPISTAEEDEVVRDLYGRTYVDFYDDYPAIRKMVKSALKMGLRADATTSGSGSAVQDRFQAKGGEFWVAKDAGTSAIVGCVGVRRKKKRVAVADGEESAPSLSVVDYEVQRLAVDGRRRGRGVGKKLLAAVEEYVVQTNAAPATITLWAVTPECLIAANKLYESAGYAKEETFQAGALGMNVYCKPLPAGKT